MDWSDVLRGALSFFLVVTGVGLGYLFLRLGGVFGRLGSSVTRVTDEVVPILEKAQTTVDGVNLELTRVDEIMQTAVTATKGAEKTVSTVSSAVTAPVRKASGIAAALKEGWATFRSRRASERVPEEPGDVTAQNPVVEPAPAPAGDAAPTA